MEPVMERRLYVLRHAKSAWDSDSATDFDRPLAKRGKRDAPRMGAFLREREVQPDHVVSSPARRAWQTVKRVCAELGIDKRAIARDPRIYDAGLDDLLAVIADCPEQARAMLLTGHNPGLEELLAHLCAELPSPADGKLLPTAALACVRLADPWRHLERGQAELEFLARPRDLT